MKSQIYNRLALVAMLFSLVFVVTNATAKKPVKPSPEPDQTTAECIVFTGDLMGEAVVEGCCPNAGPFPEYAMTLHLKNEDRTTTVHYGEYDGELFINNYGAGRHHGYQVQFWSWDWDTEIPVVGDICIEVIGGIIDNDKKNKVLRVSFNGEEAHFCETGETGEVVTFPLVNFDLIRTSDLSFCDE
jgi:hypothetical protein